MNSEFAVGNLYPCLSWLTYTHITVAMRRENKRAVPTTRIQYNICNEENTVLNDLKSK